MTEVTEPVEESSEPLNAPRLKTYLVDDESSLRVFLKALAEDSRPIALDAERASGFRYGQKAYLLQVAIRDKAIYLIDPVAEFDSQTWERFLTAVSNKTWIIHAASQDLPCLIEMRITPSKILDTELAARLLGLPRVALGTITEHYLKLKLAKEHSAVDWSERPLPQAWLNYAALDVDVLFELWDAVEQDLKEQAKSEIAEAEFNYLLVPNMKEPKIDRWRTTTGLHEVKDQRALTIAKHLWEAREELAFEKDIAPGRLIPDASIVAATKAEPKTRSELAALRSFSGRGSRTFIDIWWKAIQDGATTKNLIELRPKSTGIPNHRNWPQKFPEAHARLMASKALLLEIATTVQIPQENILNPELLRQICFEPPLALTVETVSEALRAKRVREWQIELVAEPLTETLAVKTFELKETTEKLP